MCVIDYVPLAGLDLLHTMKVKVAQSCPTLHEPMVYTVHGILQARILQCVAIPFTRGSSQPRDQTQVSCVAGGFFTVWTTSEVPSALKDNGILCSTFPAIVPLFHHNQNFAKVYRGNEACILASSPFPRYTSPMSAPLFPSKPSLLGKAWSSVHHASCWCSLEQSC